MIKKSCIAALCVLCFFTILPCSAAEISYEARGGHAVRIREGERYILEKTELQAINGSELLYWSLVDDLASENMVVPESERGVRFFGAGGTNIAFLPVQARFRDIQFSPDGSKVAVAREDYDGPTIYSLYDVPRASKYTTLKEIASYHVILGEFDWLDAHRCVFTQVEGVRQGAAAGMTSYGQKLSVAPFDAASGKIILLKKAADTRNFSLSGVDSDEGIIRIYEQSVASANDWSDEKKIRERGVAVPIPPAAK